MDEDLIQQAIAQVIADHQAEVRQLLLDRALLDIDRVLAQHNIRLTKLVCGAVLAGEDIDARLDALNAATVQALTTRQQPDARLLDAEPTGPMQ